MLYACTLTIAKWASPLRRPELRSSPSLPFFFPSPLWLSFARSLPLSLSLSLVRPSSYCTLLVFPSNGIDALQQPAGAVRSVTVRSAAGVQPILESFRALFPSFNVTESPALIADASLSAPRLVFYFSSSSSTSSSYSLFPFPGYKRPWEILWQWCKCRLRSWSCWL